MCHYAECLILTVILKVIVLSVVNAVCHYARYHIFQLLCVCNVIMLSVVMVYVVTLSVVMSCVIMLSVIILSGIMLSTTMHSDIMLSFVLYSDILLSVVILNVLVPLMPLMIPVFVNQNLKKTLKQKIIALNLS